MFPIHTPSKFTIRRPEAVLAALTAMLPSGCFTPGEETDLDATETEGSSETGTEGADDSVDGGPGSDSSNTSAQPGGTDSGDDVSTEADDDGVDPGSTDDGEDTTAGTDGTTDASSSGSSEESDTGPVCGDGVVDAGEACDEGEATTTCSAECTVCEPDVSAAIDQQLGVCVEGPSSDCRDGWSMVNGQSGIQAFAPNLDGTLDSVALYVQNDASASSVMTVHILDGGNDSLLPVGASPAELERDILGTATASGTGSFGWVEFDFADQNIDLQLGRNYFIWLRMRPPFPADDQLRVRWNLWASPEFPDPYDGGRSFFCPAGQDCDAQLQHWDYAFRTYVVPEPPVCEP